MRRTTTPVRVRDIVFCGSLAATGQLGRVDAALKLRTDTFNRLDVDTALQLIDTWRDYLTPRPSRPAARRSLLHRAGHRLHLTRHPTTTS